MQAVELTWGTGDSVVAVTLANIYGVECKKQKKECEFRGVQLLTLMTDHIDLLT